jgi:ferrochelatase
MEVAFDLDTEALETAASLGLVAVRADTVGTREPFVRGLVDLVLERAALARDAEANGAHQVTADVVADAAARRVPEATVGDLPPYRSVCRPGCCQMRAGTPTGIPAACSTDPLS